MSPSKSLRWGIGLLLCLLSLSLQAQRRDYYPFFQQEYWFGHLPGARAEAMGRADVAVGNSITSRFSNPAGIGLIQDQEVDLSTSAPYYLATNADFYFAGYAQRIHPKLTVALSVFQLAIGPTGFTVDIGGDNYPLDEPKSTTLTATVAAEVLPGLQVGLNANYYRMKFFDDVRASGSFFLDAGALYSLQLPNEAELRAGVGVSNATFSEISFESPTGIEDDNVFPVTARGGVSYLQDFTINIPGAGEQSLDLLLTTEYQNLLNFAYRTAFKVGGEITLADVVAIRLGYYTRDEQDFGVANNRDRIHDFTYGFGFIIPTSRLTKGKLPFTLYLDYYALENPPVVYSAQRGPNKRGFALRLVSDLTSR